MTRSRYHRDHPTLPAQPLAPLEAPMDLPKVPPAQPGRYEKPAGKGWHQATAKTSVYFRFGRPVQWWPRPFRIADGFALDWLLWVVAISRPLAK